MAGLRFDGGDGALEVLRPERLQRERDRDHDEVGTEQPIYAIGHDIDPADRGPGARPRTRSCRFGSSCSWSAARTALRMSSVSSACVTPRLESITAGRPAV